MIFHGLLLGFFVVKLFQPGGIITVVVLVNSGKNGAKEVMVAEKKMMAVAVAAALAWPGLAQANEAGGEDAFLNLYYGGDDMVETATRVAKPISQVAENVTVITAEEIERINPHGIDELLQRLPGVDVHYRGKDFNGSSYIYVHGASEQQTILLLDGMPIAIGFQDLAYSNVVPVGIIKRIEVIRGAASSTWGSALGGVINIITKDAGKSVLPQGSVRGSYGEYGSSDLAVEAAGAAGPVGYYLHAGRQESDGIMYPKFYENNHVFGKVTYAPISKINIQFSGGHTEPEYIDIAIPAWGAAYFNRDRNDFAALSTDFDLGSGLNLHLDGNVLAKDYSQSGRSYNDPSNPTIVEPYFTLSEDQRSYGFNGRLSWQGEAGQLVAGFDYRDITLRMRNYTVPASQPARKMDEQLTGLYVNATWLLGRLTLVPGLRYDSLSEVDDLLSPSLGLVYELATDTLLRATTGQGFRKPPLPYVDENSPYGSSTNPDLEPERVWSSQLGLESTALAGFFLKGSLFYHEADKTIYADSSTGWQYSNGGSAQRRGLELSMETPTWYYLSLAANYTFLHQYTSGRNNYYQRWANLIASYDHPQICRVEMAGHYVYWDYSDANSPEDDTMLWDLTVSRDLWRQGQQAVHLFVKGRNIFNENQYQNKSMPNAPRWVEAGLKIFY